MPMTLSSSSFEPGDSIPERHTCAGDDVSPGLEWSGLPEGTRSLALVVDDEDAKSPQDPSSNWVHWLVYNLPPSVAGLPEGAAEGGLPAGALEGLNDWGETGWRGPCPPSGRHRYVHTLYALDSDLPDLAGPEKSNLERAMEGHVLAEAKLVGTFRMKGQ